MKLFPKSFRRHRIFGKSQHPKTFLIFYQRVIFKHSLRRQKAVIGPLMHCPLQHALPRLSRVGGLAPCVS
ncbi:hypothetical protein FYB92_03290 [Novacetimonas sp. GS1]